MSLNMICCFNNKIFDRLFDQIAVLAQESIKISKSDFAPLYLEFSERYTDWALQTTGHPLKIFAEWRIFKSIEETMGDEDYQNLQFDILVGNLETTSKKTGRKITAKFFRAAAHDFLSIEQQKHTH